MHGFHVILHFIGSREFFATNWTWKDFTLMTLVIEEGVSLEAVFVFKGLLNVDFGALGALIDALRNRCIAEEI